MGSLNLNTNALVVSSHTVNFSTIEIITCSVQKDFTNNRSKTTSNKPNQHLNKESKWKKFWRKKRKFQTKSLMTHLFFDTNRYWKSFNMENRLNLLIYKKFSSPNSLRSGLLRKEKSSFGKFKMESDTSLLKTMNQLNNVSIQISWNIERIYLKK